MTGKDIKFKRRFLGMTQEELADKCGVTKQCIETIENEKSRITKPMERAITEELGKAFVECKKFNIEIVISESY